MKKGVFYFLLFVLLGFLVACSAAEESKSVSEMDSANDSAAYVEKEESLAVEGEEKSAEEPIEANEQRMIIHNAIIRTNVKELVKAQSNIEQKVKEYGGYIVESNVYKEDDQTSNGHMVVRIPEMHFETFLSDAEGEASKVLERNVTGQDVTEQYVDLTSRLKSKRVVEERLLTFMEGAEKTEDLLKISSDLAKVQEEIEVIVGKMKYLENQSSFSTIELTMIENRVIVPGIENNDLNTWEKTKSQFVTSTNAILAGASAIVVFFIGNLPVFLILSVIAFAVYWMIKRRRLVQKQ
ncbi:DUF4349 domain-containing protein [Psychrobacillus sp. NEAU-3TGS]|uniref:DUF4349 domain-containing protein n=1 Tax=Psychrobacillus sp. NEAU-3TGS TaxID=2995412 RepID=UPI0024993AFC|nr:DUF4349 domain-containing protein [Psychrobacillus sp. NEAU-3TGS]MDI2586832.1 DUF4349 domain-containing protein [Psychrobacillus sp. NEAU-3TGS]